MLQDARHTLRVLGHNPGFATTVVGSMAVGIAACTAIVSLVYTLLFRPLDVPRAQDIVSIYSASNVRGGFGAVSVPDYRDLMKRRDIFDNVAGYIRLPAFMELADESERVVAEIATGTYHTLFGLRPAQGRLITANDDRIGTPIVAVISHRYWRQRFGASPGAIGTHVRINGQPVEIIGVAPASFTGVLLDWYGAPDLWLPLAQLPTIIPRFARLNAQERRDIPTLQLVGRKRPELSVEQVNAALRSHAIQLSREYPTSHADTTFLALQSAQARFWPGRRGAALNLAGVLLASVAILLLIAVLNVANLLIARLQIRRREISVRLAIGAGRTRIFRQLIVEGVVLSGLAAIVSVPLSMVLTQLLVRLHLPFYVNNRGLDLSPDWRIFAATAALSVMCGVAIGLLPACSTWRVDIRSGLTGVASYAPTQSRLLGRWDLRHTLAALQIAVCLLLTIGAALLAKNLVGLLQRDLGFKSDHVTLFGLEPHLRNYTGEESTMLYDALIERVRRLPGVESAAFAADVVPTRFKPTQVMVAPDALDTALRVGVAANVNAVSTDYFDTLRLPLLAGRPFRSGDRAAGGAAVAIVDEGAARRTWGTSAAAVGQRIHLGKERAEYEIVGVTRAAAFRDEEVALPFLFVPIDQSWAGGVTLHVRGPRQPDVLTEQVRRELRTLDRSLAFSEILTFDDFLIARFAAPNVAAQLAVAASLMGFVLAMIGLYAVLTYLVSQRRAELALRMAIGAAPRDILWMVASAGLKVACVGLAFGVFGSLLTMRLLETQLRAVDVRDPLIYLSVCALVLVAALVATLIPARRAGQLEPWAILRR